MHETSPLADSAWGREGVSPDLASRKLPFDAIRGEAATLDDLASYWTGWAAARVEETLELCRRVWKLDAAGLPARADKWRPHAAAAMLRALVAGLAAREGRWLRPLLIVRPEDNLDWLVASLFAAVAKSLSPATPAPSPAASKIVLNICETCTLVFRLTGRRRRGVTRCWLCRQHPPPPAVLGATRDWLTAPLRALVLDGDGYVCGWRSARVGQCAECGEHFVAKRSTRKYRGDRGDRCKHRQARRV